MNGAEPAGERWPYRIATATVALGLLVTAALTLLSHSLYTRNEKQLLELRGREVASVIGSARPTTQTTFASAAAFADATHGDAQQFRRFIAPYVGPARAQQFVSMSLWRLHAPDARPVVTLGTPPTLTPGTARARAFLAESAATPKLSIIGLRRGALLSGIGYAFDTPGSGRYLVYGERPLPQDEQRTIAQTLQHALLPDELPPLDGAEASARYEPGERGVDIGGDWYDVIPLSNDRLLVVVGDVSGRGLAAGTTMASLRYAIHAYAAQHDPPEGDPPQALTDPQRQRWWSARHGPVRRDRHQRPHDHPRQRRSPAPTPHGRWSRRVSRYRCRRADWS